MTMFSYKIVINYYSNLAINLFIKENDVRDTRMSSHYLIKLFADHS